MLPPLHQPRHPRLDDHQIRQPGNKYTRQRHTHPPQRRAHEAAAHGFRDWIGKGQDGWQGGLQGKVHGEQLGLQGGELSARQGAEGDDAAHEGLPGLGAEEGAEAVERDISRGSVILFGCALVVME